MKNQITPIFITLLFVSFLNFECKKDKEVPGPISVNNSVSPTTINRGDIIHWTIKVTNLGDKVEIEKVHVKEEFISGWAQGQGTVEIDLPISTLTINAHETKTVYDQLSTVYNTGTTDIVTQNTVTVYSNGGEDTDVAIYTIKMAKKNNENFKNHTVQGIIYNYH